MGSSSTLRALLVALAAVLVALAGTSTAVVQAVYDGREVRTLDRGLRDVEFYPGEEPVIEFAVSPEEIGGRQGWVVYLEPTGDGVPPPPGVEGWPGPGEAVVSPGVVALEGDTDRWGNISGTIDTAGLGSPRELFVYSRPLPGTWDSAHTSHASGFGDQYWTAISGEYWDVMPSSYLIILIVLMWLVPASAMLINALGLNAEERNRRQLILETLGSTPGKLWREEVRSLGWPLLAGFLIASSIVGIASAFDVDLPAVDYTILSADIRANAGVVWAAFAAAWILIAVICALAAYPRRPRHSTRVHLRPPRYSGWLAFAGAAVIIFLANLAQQQALSYSDAAVPSIVLGLVAGLVFFPFICGWLVKTAAALSRLLGRRRGAAGLLIGGGQLGGALREHTQMTTLSAVSILLVTQVAVWSLLGQTQVAEAKRIQSVIGGDLVAVSVPQTPAADRAMPQVLDALPDRMGYIWMEQTHEAENFTASFLGSDTALDDLGLAARRDPQPSASLPLALDAFIGGQGIPQVTVHRLDGIPTASDDASSRSLIVYDREGPISNDDLRPAISGVVAPPWTVGIPNDAELFGGQTAAHQYRWIGWVGAAGVIPLLIGLWIGLLDNIRRGARQVAPLGALGARPHLFNGVALVRAAFPVGISVVVGGSAGLLFSRAVEMMNSLTPPYGTVLILCTVIIMIGAAAGVVMAHAGQRAAQRWKPGQEDR